MIFNAYASIKGALTLQDAGRLDGSGQIVVSKQTQWLGGKIAGGPSVMQCSGGLVIDTPTVKSLDSRRINVAGTASWIAVRYANLATAHATWVTHPFFSLSRVTLPVRAVVRLSARASSTSCPVAR